MMSGEMMRNNRGRKETWTGRCLVPCSQRQNNAQEKTSKIQRGGGKPTIERSQNRGKTKRHTIQYI